MFLLKNPSFYLMVLYLSLVRGQSQTYRAIEQSQTYRAKPNLEACPLMTCFIVSSLLLEGDQKQYPWYIQF